MGSRKGLFVAIRDRFDSLMAIGESRYEAKKEMRASGGKQWTVSTGKIHSWGTRHDYQQHVMRFARWAKEHHEVRRLDHLDQRAGELATAYLDERLGAGRSAYTVQAERAALRLFFDRRDLAASVKIPKRAMNQIRRSRGTASHDRHFNPANWSEHIAFAQATGLRRSELRDLRIRDVGFNQAGQLEVHVQNGKGGRARSAPVLPGREQEVLSVLAGRKQDERVFGHIPKHMDVHSYRRDYAQALYLHHAPGRALPPTSGRLRRSDYDKAAVQRVSWALGHNRLDVVLRHYIR